MDSTGLGAKRVDGVNNMRAQPAVNFQRAERSVVLCGQAERSEPVVFPARGQRRFDRQMPACQNPHAVPGVGRAVFVS